MLKDIIEERQKQIRFCKKGGIHTCRLGAIHVYSDRDIENINLHIEHTAQIVAREVLRLVKDKVELERFSAWSPNDPALELISKGSKDTADAVLIYLQSLEEELK